MIIDQNEIENARLRAAHNIMLNNGIIDENERENARLRAAYEQEN